MNETEAAPSDLNFEEFRAFQQRERSRKAEKEGKSSTEGDATMKKKPAGMCSCVCVHACI